uniref:Uncharacterized protein n=1 Tax=Periophthalmus magnuspinnatus TaxID=409849 RepID=A0A3B3ZW05_9GOBI
MATLARQIPSPDTFLCQPWSSFVSAAQLPFVDNMLVYCPFLALEDFCLVVCHVCNQVVTPQANTSIFTQTWRAEQGISRDTDETVKQSFSFVIYT